MCGRCCTRRGKYGHVYVNAEEIRALAAVLEMSVRKFEREYTLVDPCGWTQLVFEDEHCPFFEPGTAQCRVYQARPTQCRTFPFWSDMVGPRGWTREARNLCEGVGRGPSHDAQTVEARMVEMESWDDP